MAEEQLLKIGDTVKSDFRIGRLATYCGMLPNGQHIVYYEESEKEDSFYTALDHVVKVNDSLEALDKEINRLIALANKYKDTFWKLNKD